MAKPPGPRPHCPFCRKAKTYRIFGNPNIIIKGERPLYALLDESKPAKSTVSGTGISMEAQRQAMSRVHLAKKKKAKENQKARRGTRRKDGELRHVGSMSVELFRAAQRSRGRHFYKENPREALKQFGCGFDE